MIQKEIMCFEQKVIVACDEKCHKAWGINNRPRIQLDKNNEDDYVWLSDDELGEAPIDLGTYEGGHAKPSCDEEKMNKWCCRECERCCYMSKHGEFKNPQKLKNFSERVYNIQRG